MEKKKIGCHFLKKTVFLKFRCAVKKIRKEENPDISTKTRVLWITLFISF